MKTIVSRALVGIVATAALSLVSTSPALAYGRANWQITFAGTAPGFGFWGWCDLAGGTTFSSGVATSGTSGDCQFAEYVHEPGTFSGTCQQSVDLMPESGQPAWQQELSSVTGVTDWFFSGISITHPSSETAFCETLPGAFPPTFTNADSQLPFAVGHSNLNGAFGLTEFQMQQTPLP